MAPAPGAPMLSSYVVYLPAHTPSKSDAQLLSDSWWREVFASSAQTFADMPRGLYWGFPQRQPVDAGPDLADGARPTVLGELRPDGRNSRAIDGRQVQRHGHRE
jgi:hypothetical protein